MELGRLVLVWRGVPWCGGQPDAVAMQAVAGGPAHEPCRVGGAGARQLATSAGTKALQQLATVTAPGQAPPIETSSC